ncbi:hypothetical protein EM858_16675 [Agrobacterium sp. CNPSo 2736]|nr:hypothetical protein EM858_16675 [Agrobacterium sp. CNPSo 2736]TGE89367.1 hypothetical protein C9418_13730 [Rhizobium sp. SEMIA 4032]
MVPRGASETTVPFVDSIPSPSFLCLSQESSRRASARRRESFQPKDLGWLDLCDKHRDEGREARWKPIHQPGSIVSHSMWLQGASCLESYLTPAPHPPPVAQSPP